MLRTKSVERIVCATTALMLAVAAGLWGLVEPARGDGSHTVGYEQLLFDQSAVHTIDITMADWENFIANATAEEYVQCDIAIDGERYDNVAIRAKGNTSLSSVAAMGSIRYSFKVEFDHYVKGMTYHGLDKLSLNNLIQDATMMKDYLAYTLMNRMNVPSSLCSYVQINVNGEPWGLYLAVEGVEEAFLDRNGMSKGELYKPDSMSFGGGRGQGKDFSFDQFREKGEGEGKAPDSSMSAPGAEDSNGEQGSFGGSSGAPEGLPEMPQGGFDPSGGEPPAMPDGSVDGDGAQRGFPEMPGGGGFNFGMGNDDVKLIYSDDDPENYSNIFNNAKTSVGKKDKARLIEALRRLNAGEELDDTVQQDEVIRYLVVHNFLCNDDSYTGMMVHNYYLYEENGQLSIIPWDYNLAFGGFSAASDATSTVNSPIDSPVSGGTVDSRPLIAWIFSDEAALADYHSDYNRFIEENIESGWLAAEIDRVQALIALWLERDASAFYSMEQFEKAVETLKTFCQKRGESIRGQLEGTIPSTSQAQRDDRGALVDASDISIADMGSMNTGRGDGVQGPGGAPDASGPEGAALSAGMPEASERESGASFGGSAGGRESARSETPPPQERQDQAAMLPVDVSGETPVQPVEAVALEGQEGSARQNGFPGREMPDSPANQAGQWIQLTIWSIVLLAAILIIRRAGNHNH